MDGAVTIDELAQRVGMTTRNIRAHQTRGLLPPPLLEGRTGRYGPAHADRLLLIKRLQEQGLNLQAIALVVQGRTSDEAARIRRAVLEPWATEEPVEELLEKFVTRFNGVLDVAAVERAVALDVLEMADDTTVRVNLPAVLRSSEALFQLGVPLPTQIDALEAVDEHVRAVAQAYIALAREHLVSRLVGESLDPEALGSIVAQLRSVAADVLMTLFQRAMTEETDRLAGELLAPD